MRAFVFFILLLSFLKGEEYIFWARLEASDFMLSSNDIYILKAMSSSKPKKLKQICSIDIHDINLSSFNDEIKLKILQEKQNKLFECFLSYQSKVSSWSKLANLNHSNRTEILISPIRFVAEFKPDLVIIYTIN